jgi:hypothetical protein
MQTNQTPEALAEECKRLVAGAVKQWDVSAEIVRSIDRLRDDLIAAQSRVAELASECQLATHKVITCGVAARHPDAALASTGPYAGEWDSPQAQEVRDLRADRDRLRDMVASGAAVVNAAREAMNESFEAGNDAMDISIPSHLAAALSLRLDEHDDATKRGGA